MIISWEKIVKSIGFVGLLEHEEDRMIFFLILCRPLVRSSNWFILTVMGGMGNHLSWYEKNPFSPGDSNCLWVMRDLKSSVNWTTHIISLGMKTQTQTTGGFLKETPDKAENFFIRSSLSAQNSRQLQQLFLQPQSKDRKPSWETLCIWGFYRW